MLTRRARDLAAAGPTSTGTDSPVSMRLVDRRRALLDDAVGRDLLAGPHDEAVAGPELVDRHEHLGAVAQHARLLRAELEQRAGSPRAERRLARASR